MGMIADVFVAQLIKPDGSVLASATLQDATISVKVQENDIRGGVGDNILYSLHSGRDITVTLNDPEFRYDMLAAQLGQDIVTGAGVAYATSKFYTVASDLTVTLDNAPTAASTLVIYGANGTLLPSADYTLATDKITFSTGAVAGDQVEVRSYQYNTDATTESITIDATKFATGVKLVLETAEINDLEQVINKIQFQFTNAIPDGNFDLKTTSNKQGTVNTLTMKILKPTSSDVIGQVLRIPVAH